MKTYRRDITFAGDSFAFSDAQLEALENVGWGLPLWLWGEPGSGKTHLARALAEDAGIVEVHAADLDPKHLAACIVDAEGVRLLIEGVEHLSFETQRRLLSILDSGHAQIRPGGQSWSVDPHIIATSSHSPHDLIAAGMMVGSLAWRLAGLVVHLPPLRDCYERLEALALELAAAHCIEWTEDALAALEAYPWPGNAWQLRALVLQLRAVSRGHPVEIETLAELLPLEPPMSLAALVDDAKSGMPDNAPNLTQTSTSSVRVRCSEHHAPVFGSASPVFPRHVR